MLICGFIVHRLNPLLRTTLGFFLVHSTFLQAHAALWTERFGTIM